MCVTYIHTYTHIYIHICITYNHCVAILSSHDDVPKTLQKSTCQAPFGRHQVATTSGDEGMKPATKEGPQSRKHHSSLSENRVCI